MKKEIEKAIKETLVIQNPESIWRAVDKITSIVERESALSMSGVSGSVPYVDREKVLEESLSVLLEMASTWGREWFKSETWEKVEKARQVLAGTDR